MVKIIENITSWLRDILAWLEETKTAQITNANIRTYVKTSTQWAGTAVLNSGVTDSRVAIFEVSAIAKNQPFLFADCISELRQTSDGSIYTPKDELDDLWWSVDNKSYRGFRVQHEMMDISSPDPKTKKWTMRVSAPINTTFYMNFVVISTDDVEIEVVKR